MKTFNYITILLSVALMAKAVSASPIFYPPSPSEPRIQYLDTLNGPSSLYTARGGRGAFGDRFPGYDGPSGTTTRNKDDFIGVGGITATAGKIFVCDMSRGFVYVLDLSSKVTTLLGHSTIPNDPSKLSRPVSIRIDSDGTRYVVDSIHKKVFVYSNRNLFLRKFAAKDKAWTPIDLQIDRDQLYVVDKKNNQIVVMNKLDGTVLRRISRKGYNPGNLHGPSHITMNQDRVLFISNSHVGRVDLFDTDGKYLGKVAKVGLAVGGTVRPKGLALDKDENLFVVDRAFEGVSMFNKDKRTLMVFGRPGTTRGSMNLPFNIAVDYNNTKYFKDKVAPGHELEYLIYVTNSGGPFRVQVYGFLKQ